jgi:hypothetical protein
MARTNLKFDKTNSLNTNKKNTPSTNSSNSNTRVVGVKIDTKSTHTKDKIYYYKTNQDLKRGERIRVRVPSGGCPVSTVAVSNSKKEGKFKPLIIEK